MRLSKVNLDLEELLLIQDQLTKLNYQKNRKLQFKRLNNLKSMNHQFKKNHWKMKLQFWQDQDSISKILEKVLTNKRLLKNSRIQMKAEILKQASETTELNSKRQRIKSEVLLNNVINLKNKSICASRILIRNKMKERLISKINLQALMMKKCLMMMMAAKKSSMRKNLIFSRR
jgi:hypothetical protein